MQADPCSDDKGKFKSGRDDVTSLFSENGNNINTKINYYSILAQ